MHNGRINQRAEGLWPLFGKNPLGRLR